MSELRKDPIIGRWVIISTERGKRPSDFSEEGTNEHRLKTSTFCPFCPGNESMTPPPVLVYQSNAIASNSPWKLRVVSNKYPALKIEGELDRRGEGIFDMMNGIGAHEVIIESPDHLKDLVDLEEHRIEDVLWAYRDRMIDLKRDKRFKYILIFKNQGSAAGASLEHTHSQLIATPIVPKRVMEEISGAEKYYEYKERCVFCDIIRTELEKGVRIVLENDYFCAIEPFAPRFPFETWVLPKQHDSVFEDCTKPEYVSLSKILKETLKRIKVALNNPPFNYVIHSSPIQNHVSSSYHWHIEIMPKLTKVAGFEWGSGFYINPTPPETAAKYLKEVKIDQS
jgi:UDPglucose--hexose-1-phosphate uridylyltransferase